MSFDAVRNRRPQPASATAVTRMSVFEDGPALLSYCVRQGLIHPEDWSNTTRDVREQLETERSLTAMLERLVSAKLLTQYQADRIDAHTTHGLLLGSYRVLNRIGAGGMGVVFLAEHIHLRRHVAIKMLPLYSGTDQNEYVLSRFFNEIRAVAQLQHPNIVWAIDTGELAGENPDAPPLYYHVMEYVPGVDLEAAVRASGRMSSGRACDVAYQIASALVEAERHNLVHRDIKPSNILVTPEGQAKLLDFGLARSTWNRQTLPGLVIGTVDYLAPEQARDASSVDIRADIYSLGGTLFWALTGSIPFPSEHPLQAQVLARQNQSPPSAIKIVKDIDPELDGVIRRMMATLPEDRYANPRAVMRALLPFLQSSNHRSLDIRHHHESPSVGRPSLSPTDKIGVRRLLIVDDDPMMRTFARQALGIEGWECHDAADGQSALAKIREKRFDLVLLDVEMPGMRGDEVLERLRREPPIPNLKIIMSSGRATAEEMSNMMLGGADDFIAKPYSVVQLKARVRAALRLKEAQDRSDSLAHSLQIVNQQLENNLRSRDSDLVEARNALTLAIAELATYRGVETPAHLERIQQYVHVLAEEAAKEPYFAGHIDAAFLRLLEPASPLHDIGMIGLPDHIFLKPGKLTDDERILMRSHTSIGGDILKKIARTHGFAEAFLQMASDISRHHHERWDGRGYPDRLANESIPLAARIVAVADVYDALRSRRLHKPALSHPATIEIMTEASDGQFDPNLLRCFQRCADRWDQIFRGNPD